MTDDTTTNDQAEPLEQQLDALVTKLGDALNGQNRDLLAKLREMIEMQPGQARELASARNQRDYLGHQLSDRIARFHALRVAFGETSLDTASRTTAGELGAFEQACVGIAKQAGVEA